VLFSENEYAIDFREIKDKIVSSHLFLRIRTYGEIFYLKEMFGKKTTPFTFELILNVGMHKHGHTYKYIADMFHKSFS
jgi:hypothetical protein